MRTDLPGQVVNVGTSGRVSVPADILAQMSWWKNETTDVTLELLDRGWARLHRSDAVADVLTAATAEALGSLSDEARTEPRDLDLALSDRERRFSLYGGDDCRLRLTKEVLALFGPSRGAKLQIFLQPVGQSIDFLSLDRREERLRLTADLLGRP
jgi:hypothetical protein